MDVVLIAGLWLERSAWDAVASALEPLGHRAVPVDTSRTTGTTLDEVTAAVLDAVDAADQPMVVGHSAACTLAWLAADARPDRVARTVLIGGFPANDGAAYADFGFDMKDGAMPFPGWGPFEGPDSADLDEGARRDFEAAAIAVPEGVALGVVHLSDERRFDVPVTVVCPEFSPDEAKAWIAAGDVPELARAKHVDYVDLDSGHWPMITRPDELARLLAVMTQPS